MKYLIALIAVAAVLPMQLHARTWHVYPNDSIQDVIDNDASSGDVVVVHSEINRGYTYCESITLKSGVTVRSVSYEEPVTIDGGTDYYTVRFEGDGGGLHFGGELGGPDEGFIIKGGSRHGIYLHGARDMQIHNIVVESDPSGWDPSAAVYCRGCWDDLLLASMEIYGQVNCAGLYLDLGAPFVNDLTVNDVTGTAVYAEWNGSYFNNPTIENCGKGFDFWVSCPFVDGGTIRNCEYGVWSGADYNWYASAQTFMGVQFDNCTTGLRFWPDPTYAMWVHLTACTFQQCTEGVVLTDTYGYVKNCDFENIYDTAVRVAGDAGVLELGGPTYQERNHFDHVDGAGVQVVVCQARPGC